VAARQLADAETALARALSPGGEEHAARVAVTEAARQEATARVGLARQAQQADHERSRGGREALRRREGLAAEQEAGALEAEVRRLRARAAAEGAPQPRRAPDQPEAAAGQPWGGGPRTGFGAGGFDPWRGWGAPRERLEVEGPVRAPTPGARRAAAEAERDTLRAEAEARAAAGRRRYEGTAAGREMAGRRHAAESELAFEAERRQRERLVREYGRGGAALAQVSGVVERVGTAMGRATDPMSAFAGVIAGLHPVMGAAVAVGTGLVKFATALHEGIMEGAAAASPTAAATVAGSKALFEAKLGRENVAYAREIARFYQQAADEMDRPGVYEAQKAWGERKAQIQVSAMTGAGVAGGIPGLLGNLLQRGIGGAPAAWGTAFAGGMKDAWRFQEEAARYRKMSDQERAAYREEVGPIRAAQLENAMKPLKISYEGLPKAQQFMSAFAFTGELQKAALGTDEIVAGILREQLKNLQELLLEAQKRNQVDASDDDPFASTGGAGGGEW
jgi:hypothetical protein